MFAENLLLNSMKKSICRNIAIVSAVFIVSFSIMLIVNYYQTGSVNPLQIEVVETLKQINDANANNPVLQEQIRQLDLLSRKAYFVSFDRLIAGVYILLGMLAVFLICARVYFADSKDIPDKNIDPVDEWAIKTKARQYVVWGVSGLAVVALVFVIFNSTNLKKVQAAQEPEMLAQIKNTEDDVRPAPDPSPKETEESAENETQEISVTETSAESPPIAEAPAAASTPQPEISKVTHNAFRGNNSNGISAAKNVPVRWDLAKGTNIAWRHENPRMGFNSPVINSNKVFFTGADEQARELFCYDLTTGESLWSLVAENIPGSPANPPETTEDTGLASSSVATNGKQVCAIFATGDLICADMNGKQLWAKNLGVPDNHYGYASSLLTFDNLLIIQYDNRKNARVIALDTATGAERWTKNRPEKINWSSPIIAQINNTSQLILMGCPAITSYNPNTGEQLWRVECLSGEVGASASSANGVVYGASEYSKLIAINAVDGSVLWDNNDFLPEVASPVATKDNIYIATSYGFVVSFDTQTGNPRVEHELGAGFYSSPVIVDGKVFFINSEGKVHIFSADNDFKLLDAFDTGEHTVATPAFTDGKIVVRTEKSIYCVAVK